MNASTDAGDGALANARAFVSWLHRLGESRYGGEAVSQLAHAEQSAQLAADAGAAPGLIAAALLHDVGHLLQEDAHDRPREDHAVVATHFLARAFGPDVVEPIRLHVLAKRYLVTADPIYFAALSPASRQSLRWQGGAFTAAEADEFLAMDYAREAIVLRRWDDLAKDPGTRTAPLRSYERLLAELMTPGGPSRGIESPP